MKFNLEERKKLKDAIEALSGLAKVAETTATVLREMGAKSGAPDLEDIMNSSAEGIETFQKNTVGSTLKTLEDASTVYENTAAGVKMV